LNWPVVAARLRFFPARRNPIESSHLDPASINLQEWERRDGL
jgi:hypothetical protein